MATDTAIRTDATIPPGLFLADVLEEYGMSQAQLARRMGRPAQAINEIVAGSKALTAETALELEQVLGVPAHIWNDLEAGYRLALARLRDEAEDLSADLEILSAVSFYPFLAKQGLVQLTRNQREKVRQLRAFLGVTEIVNVERSYSPAFRLAESQRGRASTIALASWLRTAELAFERNMDERGMPGYQAQLLEQSMRGFRRLTLKPLPEVIQIVNSELHAAGVTLLLQKSIPGCGMCGAAFWWRKRVPIVIVSDHGKTEDRFWFNLLHELSHILKHGQTRLFFDLERIADHQATEAMEREADELAMACLINRDEYRTITWKGGFPTDAEIIESARRLGIHVGIVAGRLCREEKISWNRAAKFSRKFSLAMLAD